ncbi:GNAT family N-acetyltransferase [Devosia insulae DS-56]|uniref:GNAT family N-acetyltransferase n=1 Tax=Devosia insulae DS-56 TaxID=1116389 RepID=A0A1E5XVV3_9HYPH|nr:GNAT family N-acetyltransferase [Devosia insulae]OEO32694.1 GNAT family N-acetyltransferase [Devosia insulae DS-56]
MGETLANEAHPTWDGRSILRTERLNLRTFTEADLPLYAALNADLEVMRFLGGVGLSREQSDGIASGAQRSFATTGIGKIAVERASDGAFLGMCGLSVEPWYPDDLEIGWRLARRHWGHGYASEAAAAWIGYAFDTLKAPRVISVTDVPNQRSIAVMQRIGLSLDHYADLADGDDAFAAVIYATNADTWRSDRSG